MKKQQKIVAGSLLIVVALFVSSCLPGGGNYSPLEPAGFFTGIWHGWIHLSHWY